MPPKDNVENSRSNQNQSPNSSTTASGPNAQSNPMKRNGGGVADYFAILGIGDTLELKSTQKKYQRAAGAGDEMEQMQQREALLQEEECAMVERFYREIVEVSIFSAYSDHNGTFLGWSLATSASAGGDDDRDGDDGSYGYGYGHDNNNFSSMDRESSFGSYASSKRRYQISSIVHSPSKLIHRKTINQEDPQGAGVGSNNNINSNTQQSLPKEISGFSIIYQTAKTASNDSNENMNGGGFEGGTTIHPNTSGMSYFTNDNDISLNNATLPQNNTMDTLELANQKCGAD